MRAGDLPILANRAAAEALIHRLEEQLGCRFRGLRVYLRSQGLVLEGQVGTYYAKQMAQQLVMGLTEVPIVANNIEVR